ncbi:MAG: SH3 domain-containing protein [Thermodesulfobacteriota bacterium]|nr:SH3 domain-containing protein [Thermodesulfobacteriota bacterium]
MKRLFYIGLICGLIFIAAAMPHAEEYEIKVKKARLRSGPGTSYRIVGSLEKGAKVTSISKKKDWFRIKTTKGGIAWIHSKLLQPLQPDHVPAEEYEIKVKKARLRSGPGTSYRIVGSLERGAKVTSISKKKDWFRIKTTKGGIAWIHSKLLQPLQQKNLPKQKEASIKVPIKKDETLYIKDGGIDLKDAPEGSIIASLKQGAQVRILNKKEKWFQVELKGWMEEKSISNKSKIYKADRLSSVTKEGQIKGGFKYMNVKLLPVLDLVEIVGEMINLSKNKYKTTNFIVSLYNDRGEILKTGNIIVNNFYPGQTKTFYTLVDNVNYNEIVYFKIQFDIGF